MAFNTFRQHVGLYKTEGKQAFLRGIDKEDNPYPSRTDAYFQWLQGWELAEQGVR